MGERKVVDLGGRKTVTALQKMAVVTGTRIETGDHHKEAAEALKRLGG